MLRLSSMDSSDRHILERSTAEPEQASSLIRPSGSTAPLPGGFWSRPHAHAWLWIIPLAGAGAGLLYWSHSLLPKTGMVAAPGAATIQIEPTLRVHWVGGDLNVTWKRDALTQQAGERGILRVIDGGVPRELPLTAEQLQLGQRLYTPLSNDFRVELDIVREGAPPTTETIQVLSPGKYANVSPRSLPVPTEATQASRIRPPVALPTAPPAVVPAPQTQRAAIPFTPPPSPRTAEPQRASVTPAVQPPAGSPARASAAPEPAPAAATSVPTASNTAAPEPVPVAPPPIARPEPAQQAQASNSLPSPQAVVTSPLTGRPSPPAQQPVTPPATAPPTAAPSIATTPSIAVTPSRANRTLGFVPAQPVRTVQATIPNQIRAGLNGAAQVDVRVSIDITGRVTNASMSGQTGAKVAVLRTAAEAAARQWRFQPARLRGQAVSSEIVLRFRFTPEDSRGGF